MLSWRLGLKANALYRDGSKLSQPLVRSSCSADDEDAIRRGLIDAPAAASAPRWSPSASSRRSSSGMSRGRAREAAAPPQGLHAEGRSSAATRSICAPANTKTAALGEIFIDMHKEGAAFRSLMNNFAIAISIGLQYGVPLEEFVEAFTFTRFEPSGIVEGNDAIKMATSVLDYIFRELAISYLGRTDLAHVESHDLFPDAWAAAWRRQPARPSAGDRQHEAYRLDRLCASDLVVLSNVARGGFAGNTALAASPHEVDSHAHSHGGRTRPSFTSMSNATSRWTR